MSSRRKIGITVGKYMPLHAGHIQSIIEAATQVDLLYVIGSYREGNCTNIQGRNITKKMLEGWLTEQFKGLDHIKVATVDESDTPMYPDGWEEWSKLIIYAANLEHNPADMDYQFWLHLNGDDGGNLESAEMIDLIIFGGEPEYEQHYQKYFSPCKYTLIDPKRERNNIRATQIREDMYSNWTYLPSVVRETFVKRVLITGVESCGKTTMARYLAKIFNTSWSEEVGRYYARDNYNGREDLLELDDFGRIAYLQLEQDKEAFRTANKVAIIDTDAIVTQYYCNIYTGESNQIVDSIITQNARNKLWDVIIFMEPDVVWVDDGQRLHPDQKERERLSEKLRDMYVRHGYGTYNCRMYSVFGSYNQRLTGCYDIVKGLLK